MAAKDKELEAISSIIALLKPLDATERSRVLEYILKRLEMDAVQSGPMPAQISLSTGHETTDSMVTDIRTFTAAKQPRSVNEMVALVAYYLSEMAQGSESSPTVNVDLIRKYFKMAQFPLPRVTKNALTNAAQAGYLENVARGEYRLNPVGYNLVVHKLPSGSGGPATRRITRRKRR